MRSAVPGALLVCTLVACTATPPPRSVAPPLALVPTTESAVVAVPTPDGSCALKCEAPRMIPRPPDEPDYTAHEIENANLVLSAMHDDLLACYRRRVAQTPGAHGFITADIVIGPEGHVQIVETTGGAILGDATMKCIVTRIERGIFDPPHGGGTIHVIVPFSLLRVTKAEDDAN